MKYAKTTNQLQSKSTLEKELFYIFSKAILDIYIYIYKIFNVKKQYKNYSAMK